MLKPGLSAWSLYESLNDTWELLGIGSSETHLGPFKICVKLICMQAHLVEQMLDKVQCLFFSTLGHQNAQEILASGQRLRMLWTQNSYRHLEDLHLELLGLLILSLILQHLR